MRIVRTSRSAIELCLLAAIAGCDDGGALDEVEAKLYLEPSVIDFGEVALDEVSRRSIVAGNHGAIATEVEASLSEELRLAGLPPVLAAGQRIELELELRPRRTGAYQGEVAAGGAIAEVRADVVRPVLEISEDELDFGAVVAGSTARETITLINASAAPLTIAAAPSTSEEFRADLTTALMIAPRNIAELAIEYSPRELGDDEATIAIRGLILHVRGRGVPTELLLEPARVEYEDVIEGDRRSGFFVIRNQGARAHTITSLTLAGAPAFELPPATSFELAPAEARQIDVVYAPRAAGIDSAAVIVASDGIAAPGALQVDLRGTARGKPVADIDVSPPVLSFGEGTAGVDTPRELLIRSTGEIDLVFSEPPVLEPNDARYAIYDPPPSVLHPGEARPMYVIYRAVAGGPAPLASLSFRTNDPDEPQVTVHLRP